jgi:hypothetical protein
VRVDAATLSVTVPGSPAPLIRNLVVFAAKFTAGFSAAMLPAAAARIAFYDAGVSGLIAGYFLAWASRLLLKYRAAAVTARLA